MVKAFDNLPWIVKLILCLPGLDFIWGIYRIIKGVKTKNMVMLIVGILWLIIGTVLFWIIDIISTILYKQPKFIA